nr:hypothetical protein [Methanothrix sp.]
MVYPGNVIVVKIHPRLEPHQARIGRALLDCYPRCRSVLRDYGMRALQRAGPGDHCRHSDGDGSSRENGVIFHLDARKVMFSAGNLRERMHGQSGPGEYVVDMFAGIGYFSFPWPSTPLGGSWPLS